MSARDYFLEVLEFTSGNLGLVLPLGTLLILPCMNWDWGREAFYQGTRGWETVHSDGYKRILIRSTRLVITLFASKFQSPRSLPHRQSRTRSLHQDGKASHSGAHPRRHCFHPRPIMWSWIVEEIDGEGGREEVCQVLSKTMSETMSSSVSKTMSSSLFQEERREKTLEESDWKIRIIDFFWIYPWIQSELIQGIISYF